MLRTRLATCAVCSAAGIALSMAAVAQTHGTPMRYTAAAFNLNRGAAGNIDIVVERWSTDQERNTLMDIMRSKGPEKLLEALQDMPRAGYIKTPDTLDKDRDIVTLENYELQPVMLTGIKAKPYHRD